MKQRSSLSLTIITTLLVWIISGGIINVVLGKILNVDDSLLSLISSTSAAIITIIYVSTIRNAFNVFVPTFRPEIKRISPILVVVGLIMIFAINIVFDPLVRIIPDVGMDFLEDYMKSGLWAMVSAIIVAPVFEEFIFRGVFQTNLENRFGAVKAIIFSSLIFGAIHIIPQQVAGAFASGLILGSIYYLTRSLNTAIAIHCLNNGIAFLILMTFNDPNLLENSIRHNTTTYIITYTVSLIILILGGSYVINRVKERKVTK